MAAVVAAKVEGEASMAAAVEAAQRSARAEALAEAAVGLEAAKAHAASLERRVAEVEAERMAAMESLGADSAATAKRVDGGRSGKGSTSATATQALVSRKLWHVRRSTSQRGPSGTHRAGSPERELTCRSQLRGSDGHVGYTY